MASDSKFKTKGSISHTIGIILNALLIGFGVYLFFVDEYNTLGVIVLDLYVGIVGIIFSVIGIFAVVSMNDMCLDLIKGYTIVSALFNIFFTVIHTIVPVYNDFGENGFTVNNMFYVAASGFVVSFVQNLFSFYVASSLQKIKTARLAENDIESLVVDKSDNALNETEASFK